MHRSWYIEFRMAISPQRVIRSTSCFVQWYRVFGSTDRIALFPILLKTRIHRIKENLQRHRAVSRRQHGYLVLIVHISLYTAVTLLRYVSIELKELLTYLITLRPLT